MSCVSQVTEYWPIVPTYWIIYLVVGEERRRLQPRALEDPPVKNLIQVSHIWWQRFPNIIAELATTTISF